MTTFVFESWEKVFWKNNENVLLKHFCNYHSFAAWFRWHFTELAKPGLKQIISERNKPKRHKSMAFRQIYLKRKN